MSKRFKLSKRSTRNLEGLDHRLIELVHYAINVTSTDFGVIQGIRTLEEQKVLFARGASQTMNSKHLSGEAVDVMAYIGSRGSWELPMYFDIAEAFKEASIQWDVPLRWGGAWTVKDISQFPGSMESAHMGYVEQRVSEGRRPFIDAPHFELRVN